MKKSLKSSDRLIQNFLLRLEVLNVWSNKPVKESVDCFIDSVEVLSEFLVFCQGFNHIHAFGESFHCF